ncbi:MAG: hydroxymethylglutaryl-CoA reductase, degradative [Thermoflexales bacterium]
MSDASPLPRLRDLPLAERAAALGLPAEAISVLRQGLLLEQADLMIENVIGLYSLPLGVAQHFVVNGRALRGVPMVIEEASVVAACSYAAKLARAGGGFQAGSSAPIMVGQIQVLEVPDPERAHQRLAAQHAALLHWLNQENPSTRSPHTRAVAITSRTLDGTPPMLIVELHYDCGDAMGANVINTACEALAPRVAAITGGRVNLRILSNLSDQRTAWARCVVPAWLLADDAGVAQAAAQHIVEASLFAERDPYRAATHNKGIMNGIDAVAIATGNDWRAIEAGAHAFAARSGRYTALATWRQNAEGDLEGHIELPLAVGIVGGATRVHPVAQVALQLLEVRTARELAEIMACVGLAQNFAAIRALAMEGIQQGHMSLHARQIAIAAGAQGAQVEQIAAQLVAERNVRIERARQLLASLEDG